MRKGKETHSEREREETERERKRPKPAGASMKFRLSVESGIPSHPNGDLQHLWNNLEISTPDFPSGSTLEVSQLQT